MKRKGLCLLLAMLLFFAWADRAPAAAAAPGVSAEACVLIEASTGKVLYDKRAREKRSIASTTKIMTTLLCLESGGLDDWFVVDPDAIRIEGSSMGLTEGDAVTKRALCYGMMLPSGNDAATATAVRLAGSVEAFAARMNARAKEIGMSHTCFVTPSGLEAKGHGSCAYDMALLTRTALQNEDFAAICSQSRAKVTFGNPPYDRWLTNTNKLLTSCEGVIGVKTGFTDEAGRCLVSACERGGIRLICVTLHAPGDWQDHAALYDYGFSTVESMPIPLPTDLAVPVVGGQSDCVNVYAKEPLCIGTDNGDLSAVTTRVCLPPFVYAPVNKGDPVGTLCYFYEGRAMAELPLYAADTCL